MSSLTNISRLHDLFKGQGWSFNGQGNGLYTLWCEPSRWRTDDDIVKKDLTEVELWCEYLLITEVIDFKEYDAMVLGFKSVHE